VAIPLPRAPSLVNALAMLVVPSSRMMTQAWGLTFLIRWFGSVVNWAWERSFENKLIVVDPAGEIVLEHVKYGGNMLEGSLLGDGVLRTIETPYGTLSGIICWDTDFPGIVRQAGRNGTDILLSPAHDWPEIDPIHAQMAVFRAIENGISVVRQADQGRSITVAPYGRVLAKMDHFTARISLYQFRSPPRRRSGLFG